MNLYVSVARAALVPAVAGAMTLAAGPLRAAPDEMRVMSDDLTDPGDLSLELHVASVRARSGAATRHLVQGLAEIAYGVTPTLEVSMQLPASKAPGWRANGVNVELQYIAAHEAHAGLYWGARAELGRARAALEPDPASALEFRPIVGYRVGAWHGTLNGALRTPLSGADRRVTWEPAAKLAREVAARTRLGVEYYVQSAQRADGDGEGLGRRKLALLVLDTRRQGVNLSVRIGRGIGAAADGPVVNVIAGFEIEGNR
ncbi:MAG: hypothetical protein ACXWC6_06170 [Ramlibacter sp.]